MGKNLKVSVVVITYNQERYIRHALESIMSQITDFDMEVLVADDCSTDKTAETVREFALKYPDVIIPFIREKNMGMSPNFLDLIMRTKGEYIAVLEGDDYWIDELMLQKSVDFLDAHKEYSSYFSHCIIVDQNDVRHPDRETYSGFLKRSGDYTIRDFEDYMLPGQTGTGVYRQELYTNNLRRLKDLNFDISHFIDRHFVLMMLASGKIYVSDDEVSAYRFVLDKESGSWSSKNDYYSKENLLNYFEGMKELEMVGDSLELKVDFDERRKYEWDKFIKNRGMFSYKDASEIKSIIMNDSNCKFGIFKHQLKRQIKSCLKR